MRTQKPYAVPNTSEPPATRFRGCQSYLSGVSDSEHSQSMTQKQQNKEICELHEKLIILINELEELLPEDLDRQ